LCDSLGVSVEAFVDAFATAHGGTL